MQHVIAGKRWRIEYPKQLGPAKLADCDAPNTAHKAIRIQAGAKKDKELHLECLIHEILHAVDWSKDERWVEDVAEGMARVIMREVFPEHIENSQGPGG
jgi:hypothetical protein